jgi:hypothetical protein
MSAMSLDTKIAQIRETFGFPRFNTIDDLPLTQSQKACVLEWLAIKLTDLDAIVTGSSLCGKHYDPLTLDTHKKVAHSYAFCLSDGGRHHPYTSLAALEREMCGEIAVGLMQHMMDTNEDIRQISHNPDRLTNDHVETHLGYRLLNIDEIAPGGRAILGIEAWASNACKWLSSDDGYAASSHAVTYRTKHSPEDLSKLRLSHEHSPH